ncbi:MAG: hypothetical protein ACTSRA_00695 [Promethearchaeota archaeon]|nr:MAG: hypothetical protein [Helarchaeota virus Nidhogg Meg22_1012]URC17476.1 MAG: hypothetical protein [Helarchaeota virus Nidhogg Meg22_1214]
MVVEMNCYVVKDKLKIYLSELSDFVKVSLLLDLTPEQLDKIENFEEKLEKERQFFDKASEKCRKLRKINFMTSLYEIIYNLSNTECWESSAWCDVVCDEIDLRACNKARDQMIDDKIKKYLVKKGSSVELGELADECKIKVSVASHHVKKIMERLKNERL